MIKNKRKFIESVIAGVIIWFAFMGMMIYFNNIEDLMAELIKMNYNYTNLNLSDAIQHINQNCDRILYDSIYADMSKSQREEWWKDCVWTNAKEYVLMNIKYNSSLDYTDMLKSGKNGDCKLFASAFLKIIKHYNITDKLYVVIQSPEDNLIEDYLKHKVGHACVIGWVSGNIRQFNCDPALKIVSMKEV